MTDVKTQVPAFVWPKCVHLQENKYSVEQQTSCNIESQVCEPMSYPAMLDNVVKELSPCNMFHDHEDVSGSGDHLVPVDVPEQSMKSGTINDI